MWSVSLVFCDCGFYSVCPLIDNDKRLMGAFWLRRKLGLVLMGRAMFSKSLIQLSVDGWGCVPSLLFTWGQTMLEVMKTITILKSRDITLPTNVHLVKAMVFPVVMYGCESWTVKKLEHQRNDAFELWCWRRLLRVLWTARRSNQSILKEISPECSLEGLMLKLKLQYFGHLMRRADSFEKILMLGKIEGGRRGWQRMRWLDGITESMNISLLNSGSWWWTGRPGVLQSMGLHRVGHNWASELNWMKRMAERTSICWCRWLSLECRDIYFHLAPHP